jgi:bile acid:Na+ symporter, BASS family
MPADFLKTVILPLALMLIMFGMGMTLTLADFRRVLTSPLAVLTGVLCQMIGLPLLALGITTLLGLPPELAVGLMLIAACPGGPTSNVITHLSRGDTALSVTLTAVSSVLTVFTIPALVAFAIARHGAGGGAITLPFGSTVTQLMVITLLPIALGMWLHSAKPAFTQRMSRPVNGFSIVFLVIIILIAILREKDLGTQFALAGPAAFLLNIGSMLLGYVVAAVVKLGTAQRITIAIEAGIQNGTLALAIALGMLESSRIAIPAVVYSLLMFASGGFMILYFGKRRPHAEQT